MLKMANRYQLIIDAKVQKELDDKEFIVELIKEIARLIDMRIIFGPAVADGVPQNPGLSAFAIIDFSHISIHTFKGNNQFCLDIFSCKKFDFNKLKEFIKKTFRIEEDNLYFKIIEREEI